jgi:hypothetical protein
MKGRWSYPLNGEEQDVEISDIFSDEFGSDGLLDKLFATAVEFKSVTQPLEAACAVLAKAHQIANVVGQGETRRATRIDQPISLIVTVTETMLSLRVFNNDEHYGDEQA